MRNHFVAEFEVIECGVRLVNTVADHEERTRYWVHVVSKCSLPRGASALLLPRKRFRSMAKEYIREAGSARLLPLTASAARSTPAITTREGDLPLHVWAV